MGLEGREKRESVKMGLTYNIVGQRLPGEQLRTGVSREG